MSKTRVLIVGTGLVGASLGCALSRAGFDVSLADLSASHAVVAAGLGAGRLPEPGETYDLIVVATPPAVIAEVVTQMLKAHPQAIVTDVGSVKAKLIADVAKLAGDNARRYVPSHPMAGSQYTGPLTASADLFIGRTWVVTPAAGNAQEHVDFVVDVAEKTGARVIIMDARAHDEAVAQISHVPHLMSILTASHLRQVPADNLRLAGQGVRDVTRIAGSDPGLWRQIISINSDAIRAELEHIQANMARLMTVLDSPESLEEFLGQGQTGAKSLLVKHGAKPLDVLEVTVEIPDEPRSLARLFADIGDTGFNVEDFELRHDPVREIGYLTIAVEREVAGRFQASLSERGWSASSSVVG